MEQASDRNKQSIAYVRAILDRLVREGITTNKKLQQDIKIRHGPTKSTVNDGVLSHNYTEQDYEEILARMEEI